MRKKMEKISFAFNIPFNNKIYKFIKLNHKKNKKFILYSEPY